MDGLIPSTATQISVGRAGFVTAKDARAEEQLLAVCRLREKTKSWDRLAVLLWLDDWAIEPERVRRAILSWLPPAPPWQRLDDTDLDRLDAIARRRGPPLARRLGIARLGRHRAAEGVFVLLSQLLDRGHPLDDSGVQAIESVMGDAPDSRAQSFGAFSAKLLAPLFKRLPFAEWRTIVEQATSPDIDQSRPWAQLFWRDLPAAAEAVRLAHGQPVFGVLTLRAILEMEPRLAPATALYFASTGYGDAMDELVRTAAESVAKR
jgi:hypothetical protein